MTGTGETHGADERVVWTTRVGPFSHLDLDVAIEHARQLRVDHLPALLIPLTRRWRYVAFIVRRGLHPGTGDRADPARWRRRERVY
jgi:hypothetical protein